MKNSYFIRIGDTFMNRFNVNSIACSSLKDAEGPHTVKVAFRDGQVNDFTLDSLTQLHETLIQITNEYSLVPEIPKPSTNHSNIMF